MFVRKKISLPILGRLSRGFMVIPCIFCKNQYTGANYRKISNNKHQITNNSKITISNDQKSFNLFVFDILGMFGILNFYHCDLFGIWYLWFGISGLSGLGFRKDSHFRWNTIFRQLQKHISEFGFRTMILPRIDADGIMNPGFNRSRHHRGFVNVAV